jgi:hypothetical protein
MGAGGGGGDGLDVGSTEKLIWPVTKAVEDELATCTESEDCPVCVGTPEITPVEAARLRPRGSWPEATFQVYGLMPPSASRAVEYGAWTIAAGILVVRIFNVAGATVKSTESSSCPIDVDLLGRSGTVLAATEICKVPGSARSVLVRSDVS